MAEGGGAAAERLRAAREKTRALRDALQGGPVEVGPSPAPRVAPMSPLEVRGQQPLRDLAPARSRSFAPAALAGLALAALLLSFLFPWVVGSSSQTGFSDNEVLVTRASLELWAMEVEVTDGEGRPVDLGSSQEVGRFAWHKENFDPEYAGNVAQMRAAGVTAIAGALLLVAHVVAVLRFTGRWTTLLALPGLACMVATGLLVAAASRGFDFPTATWAPGAFLLLLALGSAAASAVHAAVVATARPAA